MRLFSNKAIDQWLRIVLQICTGLCCTQMHAIPSDLLIDVDPANYVGVDLLFSSFGPCPSGKFKVLGHTGCVHCQYPILLCFNMEPGEVSEIDFEEEPTFFGQIFGSKVG